MTIPRVLIVAGSDSGGGAGIQADLKTVMALGGYATTAITAITAQNTLGVTGVMAVPPAMVIAQMRAVLDDIGADAVKLGMIGAAATAHAVADLLDGLGLPVVFDPVMIATSGAVLADADTIAAFDRLARRAAVTTPNLPEFGVLAGEATPADYAARIGRPVLLKGGHAADARLTDRLVMPDGGERAWSAARIDTRHTHGTGCTLASAIATGLARGDPLDVAVEHARDYVRAAILAAPGLGAGHGPMGHGGTMRAGRALDPPAR